MYNLIVRLILILQFLSQINGNFDLSKYKIKQEQCIEVTNILINIIASNSVIKNDTVNMILADYSHQLDTSCILNSIVKIDDRVVLQISTKSKNRMKQTDVDYFVLLEDFMLDV